MRCKKHLSDHTSSVGVCATCLRERLFSLIAAQAQSQQSQQPQPPHHPQPQFSSATADNHHHHPPPPPLSFPRSVSPYVSRRKSDGSTTATWQDHHRHHHHHRFYSTPQVGPSSYSVADLDFPFSEKKLKSKNKKNRFSLLTNLFRSRSDNPRSSSSSSSWLSSLFFAAAAETPPRPRAHPPPPPATDRGMSPDYDHDFNAGGEESPPWKRTPTAARRSRQRSTAAAGMAFCLSPLVRASPNRRFGAPTEIGNSGEAVRTPAKPHLANAASFCKNRSRKLADFGRANHNNNR